MLYEQNHRHHPLNYSIHLYKKNNRIYLIPNRFILNLDERAREPGLSLSFTPSRLICAGLNGRFELVTGR